MAAEDVTAIIEKNSTTKGGLLSILEEIQAKYGYLSEDSLREVAERTGSSLVDVYGVATFYSSFSLKPRGKHLVSLCLGTACHVRGGPAIAKEIERQLGVKAGETTEDKEFTLETVNCLGACALGPVVVVDGHYFPNVKTLMVAGILEKAETGITRFEIEADQRIFALDVSCARCNHTLMDDRYKIDGRPPVKVTVSFGDKHGRLLLSSLYGSYEVDSEYPIPPETIVHLFCPHCHTEMIGSMECAACGAPMVPMIVRGGGVVQICSRRGCRGHILDLGDATTEE
jgi:NADH-quinone oxidoreductase subunit E